MLTEPEIVTKAEQPYAAIVLKLHQPEISGAAPQLIGDVVTWIVAQGGKVVGPPFFNYVSFFPDGAMEMQVGMPTATLLPADDRVRTGRLPSGQYASMTATVPYSALLDANMKLDAWANSQGIVLDGRVDGDRFVEATRLEIYHKDPGEDPSGDPVTEIAFRLAP